MRFKTLYHVTAKKNLSRILREGIRRGRSILDIIMPLGVGSIKRYVYLTDKKGIRVLAKAWVMCKNRPVVIEVKIPYDWLEWREGIPYGYQMNPIALEWKSKYAISPKYIVDAYEFEGC